MTRQKVTATAEPETRRSHNCTCAGDFYYQWRSCNTVAYINANANESCVFHAYNLQW